MATSDNSIDIRINGDSSSLNVSLRNSNREISNLESGFKKMSTSMGSMFGSIAKLAVVGVAAKGMWDLSKSTFEATNTYEQFKASIAARVGDLGTTEVFDAIQKFAKDTPFDLDQTVKAFTRLKDMGLDPSREAMLAYGNAAAAQKGKGIIDVVEAVADAVVGENERLKEFGIKASKNGEMVTYTYNNVSETFKATGENIENYLKKTFGMVANGEAMSRMAMTVQGRINALKDSFQQLQNNIGESLNFSSFFGGIIEGMSNVVDSLNEVFKAGAAGDYMDALASYLTPVINLFNKFKDLVVETWDSLFNQGNQTFGEQIMSGLDFIIDLFRELESLIDLNFFGEFADMSIIAIQPLIEVFNDMADFFKNGFTQAIDDFKRDFINTFNSLPEPVQEVLTAIWDELKRVFGGGNSEVNGFNLVEKIGITIAALPAMFKKVLMDALAWFNWFADNAIAIVDSINVAIAQKSVSAGKTAYQAGIALAENELRQSLDTNNKEFSDSVKKTVEGFKKMGEAANKAREQSRLSKIAEKENVKADLDSANKKIADYRAKEKAKEGEDVLAKYRTKTKPTGGAGSGAGKKSGASNSNNTLYEAEKKAYKAMLDLQSDQLNRQLDNNLISYEKYYSKLEDIEIQKLYAEMEMKKKQKANNDALANSSDATDKQKSSYQAGSIKLQGEINELAIKEQQIRENIAEKLKKSKEEFSKMVLSMQSDLENMLGAPTIDTAMKQFAEKYDKTIARLKVEDKENGTNYAQQAEKLKAIYEAKERINIADNENNIITAEASARRAELQDSMETGQISYSEYLKQNIALNKELNAEQLKILENQLQLALSAPAYNREEIASLKEKIALTKIASRQVDENVTKLKESFSSSFGTFFSDVLSGTKGIKSAFEDLTTSILKNITDIISKNLANSLMNSLFNGTVSGTQGASGGAGFGGIISSALSGLFGGAFANGGLMPNNSVNLVGEKGRELVFNTPSGNKVIPNDRTEEILSGAGKTTIFNIHANDPNVFRKSKNQIVTEEQRRNQWIANRNS